MSLGSRVCDSHTVLAALEVLVQALVHSSTISDIISSSSNIVSSSSNVVSSSSNSIVSSGSTKHIASDNRSNGDISRETVATASTADVTIDTDVFWFWF